MDTAKIGYVAKVNAAAWLVRNCRTIARRLEDTTREQREAIESEIVKIGQRLYREVQKEEQGK